MSWSNDKVLEFLELYKSEELLWNPKHISHRNRCEVNEAWERIRCNLGMNCLVSDLKRKKESLMTSFRLLFNKRKNSPAFRTSWFAYSLMESFLGGKYECDSTRCSETEFLDANACSYSINDSTNESHNFASKPLSDDTEKNNIVNPCRQSQPRPHSTLKRCIPTNTNIEHNDEKSSLKYSRQEFDEYDLYCQLLAKKLKKLDENQRDIVMHEIDNIMFRAKMEQKNNNCYSNSQTSLSNKIKNPVLVFATEAPVNSNTL